MFGLPFTCCPTSFHSRFEAQLFRVLLLRRLWLPLPSHFSLLPVAVLSTSLATTEQLARTWECLVAEALP